MILDYDTAHRREVKEDMTHRPSVQNLNRIQNKLRIMGLLWVSAPILAGLSLANAKDASGVGTDFQAKFVGDQMNVVITQYFPSHTSLDQARSSITSTELPVVFGRSVKVKKVERHRVRKDATEVVTYAEKEVYGIVIDATSHVDCVEIPVADGWQENCSLNIKKGNVKRVFISASSQIRCVGRNGPVCTQLVTGRFKDIWFPVSAHPKQLALASAIEALHGVGSVFTYVTHEVDPYRARQIYEESKLFSLIAQMVPLYREAAEGNLNKINLTVWGSDRSGRFDVIRQ